MFYLTIIQSMGPTTECIKAAVNDHVHLGLLKLIPASQTGLFGQESADCKGLGNLLAIIVENGQGLVRHI